MSEPETGVEMPIQVEEGPPIQKASIDRDDDHDRRASDAAGWWLMGASRRGLSHVTIGTRREDAFKLAGRGARDPGTGWFAVAVADGVGSAPMSRLGALTAVNTAINTIEQRLEKVPFVDGKQQRELLADAARAAIEAIDEHAKASNNRSPKDYATTLLVVLGVEEIAGELDITLFQAGNGWILHAIGDGPLELLHDSKDEDEEGSIYDLTSSRVRNSIDERPVHQRLPSSMIVLLTDGISDDLLPLAEKGRILRDELRRLKDHDSVGEDLLELISYQKRGSTDDRTIVCAIRGRDQS